MPRAQARRAPQPLYDASWDAAADVDVEADARALELSMISAGFEGRAARPATQPSSVEEGSQRGAPGLADVAQPPHIAMHDADPTDSDAPPDGALPELAPQASKARKNIKLQKLVLDLEFESEKMYACRVKRLPLLPPPPPLPQRRT